MVIISGPLICQLFEMPRLVVHALAAAEYSQTVMLGIKALKMDELW